MTEKELGSDQRISVHVNTPRNRIQWNVNGAAKQKFSRKMDKFRELGNDSLVHTSLSGL